MKKCNECGKRKPLDKFYNDPRQSDGHFGKCKECQTKRERARRIKKTTGHTEGYYDRFKRYK